MLNLELGRILLSLDRSVVSGEQLCDILNCDDHNVSKLSVW